MKIVKNSPEFQAQIEEGLESVITIKKNGSVSACHNVIGKLTDAPPEGNVYEFPYTVFFIDGLTQYLSLPIH